VDQDDHPKLRHGGDDAGIPTTSGEDGFGNIPLDSPEGRANIERAEKGRLWRKGRYKPTLWERIKYGW